MERLLQGVNKIINNTYFYIIEIININFLIYINLNFKLNFLGLLLFLSFLLMFGRYFMKLDCIGIKCSFHFILFGEYCVSFEKILYCFHLNEIDVDATVL